MPLSASGLGTALKSQFSNSPDPALKALTDAYWDDLATVLINYITANAEVVGVHCNTTTGNQDNTGSLQ